MSSISYPYILVILFLSYVVGQDNYKSSLTFVIDDTYSMNDGIEAINIAVNAIFDTVLHHNSLQIENFILVTFNDLITATIDPKTPTVIIDGVPKILAEYDKPLKLFCNVVGYPKANINWKNKGMGTTLTGEISLVKFPYKYLSVLTIEKVVKNATYECEGSNTSGSDSKTVEVVVREPERRFIVKDTPKIIEVEYEKEVKMYCIVDAYPPAQITWYRLDGRKLFSKGNIDISPDNSTLTFKYATIYDRGAYICEARNEDKKQQIIKHLKVLVGFESRYKTAYACEGETLKIGCPEGSFIHLFRANYGRFSMTTCNDHGNTGWSSNCMSTKSLRVLHNRCSMHNNCSTLASNTIFGDPCPNTLKYLEAHYECVPVSITSTTTTPPPPWLITSQPSVGRSTLPSISESPVQTQENESSIITPPTPEKITTSQPDSSSKRSSPDIKEDVPMIIETEEITTNEKLLKGEDFTAKLDPKTPTVIIDGDSKILAEYDKPLKLFCNVVGYPKANINWKNKVTGTTLTGEMSLVELPYKYLSVLTIEKVDTNATYECEGSNTYGSDRKSVEVEVHEPERRFTVKDTPKIVEVEYEKEAKMYCIVDAYPPAQITWYRLDGRKLFSKGNIDISPDNSTLTFKYATIYDRGAYICEARNEDKKQQIIKHLKVLVGFESRYKTAYACEGETLKIGCPEGSFIHLFRANYGRFSMTTCNDHGNTGWSSNCMSTKSLRVLHNRCSMHNNCSTLASNTIFGDPCPNTLKYLEAHYECVPVSITSTTTTPPPPWLITSQPSVGRSTLPSISESPVQTQENESSIITPPTPEKITTSQPDSSSKISSPDIKEDTAMIIETAEIPPNEKPLKKENITAKLDPKTPTVIIDGDSKILAEYDKPLKLFCNVVGYPKANINWKNKGTGTTLTGEMSLVELPYKYLSVLTIEKVDTNATYECEGSNTSGSDLKSVEVEVHEPESRFIVKDTPKIVEVEYEKEAKMYCIVDAYPPAQITWYRLDGRKVFSKGNIDISHDNSTLTFKYATIYDRGAYICEARNEDKKQQIIKHLKVLVGFESRYKTAYACEGKTLKIGCPEGSSIHLFRANYGRFSMTTCNDHGNTGWSSNCMSTSSLRVLHNRCSMQNSCSILASNTIFGDPCPNTLKYLEAYYECVPVSTTSTTTRSSPPWPITSQPSVWRSTLPSVSESPVQTQRNESTVITPSTFRPHITLPPKKTTTRQPTSSSERSIPNIKEDIPMNIETSGLPKNDKQ